jgi:hypothetical protein
MSIAHRKLILEHMCPERLRAHLPAFLLALPSPDRSRLSSVESFFRYTEEEGRRFFEELDRDGDGRVTLDDLRLCMRCERRAPRPSAAVVLSRERTDVASSPSATRTSSCAVLGVPGSQTA